MTTKPIDPTFRVLSLSKHSVHQQRAAMIAEISATMLPLLHASGLTDVGVVLWTRSVQPDSLLTRKKGFWHMFRSLRDLLPDTALCTTCVVECDGGLKFLASAQVALSDLDAALTLVLHHTRCAGVVLVGDRLIPPEEYRRLQTTLEQSTYELELARGLLPICEEISLVGMVPTGRFDDLETGIFMCGPANWEGAVAGLAVER